VASNGDVRRTSSPSPPQAERRFRPELAAGSRTHRRPLYSPGARSGCGGSGFPPPCRPVALTLMARLRGSVEPRGSPDSISSTAATPPTGSPPRNPTRDAQRVRPRHRLGGENGSGVERRTAFPIYRSADAWRPVVGRWHPTPYKRSVRAVFRDHRRSAAGLSGQHVGQPLSTVPRRRVRHPCWRWLWAH